VSVGVEKHRLMLLRHGETEWSLSGQHTGRTDIDLTDNGRDQAKITAEALAELAMDNPLVVCSPMRRALLTAKLAGLTVDEVSPLLAEWDYGDYEGLTTLQIRMSVPGWSLWDDGCAGGESVAQVSDRADRAIALALEQMESRDVVFVGHGHFSRAVITRWLELPLAQGIRFAMVAASVGVCGFERGMRQLGALGLTGYPHPVSNA
jgi:broad specificity phosphatase PhoE